jgi:hypothetical protein
MEGTDVKLTGSDVIEAKGKSATLKLTDNIEAKGSQVAIEGTTESR